MAAESDEFDGAVAKDSRLGSRAPGFIRKSRLLHQSWRVGVFLVGLAVVAGGVVLLPLPGPGWVVIFGGMAIWATEFAWAQRVLRWTRRKVADAARSALDPRVRRRNLLLTTAAVLALAGLAGCYLWQFGLDTPWGDS
ncbi:TIGR02611 family protein [Streptomyces sp. NPDC008139]|uniref:TIGR02611 family protein n=1 Tax=Streptomyces sp. NPDC008139 TaxID=3364814 RepID=UPI0036E2FB04